MTASPGVRRRPAADNAAVHPDAEETCNRVDDDCDGTVDESAEIDPLPPGIYGESDAQVRFERVYGDDSLGVMVLDAGDTNGDGVNDLLLLATSNLCYSRGYLFRGTFCRGELRSDEADAIFELPTDNSPDQRLGSRLGDLDEDGYDDVRVGPYVFYGPLDGFLGPGDAGLVLPGDPESADTVDLDGDGHTDLLVGNVRGGPGVEGAVHLHPGPI